MSLKTPRELWQDYCHVARDVRERYGLSAAISYVVGEKLMTFAQTAEADEGFRAELPAFCAKIRRLFTTVEIEAYFEAAERHSRVESDLFKGASAEETADLREMIEDA